MSLVRKAAKSERKAATERARELINTTRLRTLHADHPSGIGRPAQLERHTLYREPASVIFADDRQERSTLQAGRQAMGSCALPQQGASILLVTHDASVATYANRFCSFR